MSLLHAHRVEPSQQPPAYEPIFPMRRIGSVEIAAIRGADAIAAVEQALADLRFTRIAFVNAHCVNTAEDDASFRNVLRDFKTLPDGVGVDLGSRILYGSRFPENLNGTDFVPRLLRRLTGSRRIALVGASPAVVNAAALQLAARFPRHEFQAISHGFFKEGLETQIVLARLRDYSPDITLVGMGVPRQEIFIHEHLTIHETTVAIGVGALLDFLSGRVRRAPRLMRALRLEWLFRLCLEPHRLWRRYVVGNPRFVARILRDYRRLRARFIMAGEGLGTGRATEVPSVSGVSDASEIAPCGPPPPVRSLRVRPMPVQPR